jgi:4'-phosphopantetheinyl transferase
VPLEDGEAHVWRFGLDPPPAVLEAFERSLSDDERRRAERFRTGPLRRRFVAARGALRAILAAYLHIPPDHLTFTYGRHGKPALADGLAPDGLCFNLSHSDEVALCAVTTIGAVGVDVEAIRPMEEDGRKLIGRFFSERERAEFLSLPGHQRLAAFFRGWTRKEAFIKATGTGLAAALDSFDVTLGPDAPTALLRVGDDPSAHTRWTLLDLEPGPGYAAALAVEARGRPVKVRKRSPSKVGRWMTAES